MEKLIVGNWKMYPTLADSIVLATQLKSSLESIKGVQIAFAPPTAWLVPIAESWRHKASHLHLVAQNIWPEDQGAFTGEVSVYMLKSMISYALVGHSERRRYAGEDNELANEKVLSCLRWRITPILCVGEAKQVLGENGVANDYQWTKLVDQLIAGLHGVSKEKLADVVIAYEPIWAIGNHHAAKPEYASEVIRRLREKLAEKYGSQAAAMVRFLYGGSVDAKDAAGFLRQKEIGGLLPGTVSVKASEFVAICRLAAQIG